MPMLRLEICRAPAKLLALENACSKASADVIIKMLTTASRTPCDIFLIPLIAGTMTLEGTDGQLNPKSSRVALQEKIHCNDFSFTTLINTL